MRALLSHRRIRSDINTQRRSRCDMQKTCECLACNHPVPSVIPTEELRNQLVDLLSGVKSGRTSDKGKRLEVDASRSLSEQANFAPQQEPTVAQTKAPQTRLSRGALVEQPLPEKLFTASFNFT